MTPALALLLACAGSKTVESTPAPATVSEAGAIPEVAAKPPAPPPEADKPTMTITSSPSRAAVSDRYAPRATPFALRFHDALAGDGNSATSGISASFALGMLAEGAPEATAFEELWGADLADVQQDHARALAAYNDTPGVDLAVVNGLWTGEGLAIPGPVRERLASLFEAEPRSLPFRSDPTAAAAVIDGWTSDHTGGLITELLPPAALADARLVLANAIAFKGSWAFPFDAALTTDQPFATPSGPAQVPMMSRKRMLVRYTEGVAYQAVLLPYEGEGTSMAVVLPGPGHTLQDAADGLAADNLASLAFSSPRPVDVALPRFSIASEHDLLAAAGPLGLERVLQETVYSGFGEGLVVSKALQKVVVEVSEDGTEAAAVTAITMKRSGPPRTLAFRADRPFLFAIWHTETATPLFVGQVVDPR